MTGYATGRVAGLRAGKKPECESLKRDVRKMEAEEKDEEVNPKMVNEWSSTASNLSITPGSDIILIMQLDHW
jgi:hypothetical protein